MMETDKTHSYFPRRVSMLRPVWGFFLLLLVTPYASPRLPPAPPEGEVGIASWYGPRFHGRRTANGEVFDMHHLSAAHPTLPLGSWVEVTNLDNGRSIPLRVNDRGPFIAGRIIDVSYAAARSLDMLEEGIARVHLWPLQASPAARLSPGGVSRRGRSSPLLRQAPALLCRQKSAPLYLLRTVQSHRPPC